MQRKSFCILKHLVEFIRICYYNKSVINIIVAGREFVLNVFEVSAAHHT